ENIAPPFKCTPVSPLRPRCFYAPLDEGRYLEDIVVSIVTPTRGPQDVFSETILSVKNQSLQKWEWIIVNDGCKDAESRERLDSLAESDPRVRIFHLPKNSGPSAARNIGVEHAKGKYVFFLDDDDLLEPTALEKMAWFLEVHQHFSMTKGSTVNFGAEESYSTSNFEHSDLFLRYNPITPRVMLRRQVFLEVGGFDESIVNGLEDWDFWLRLASKGYWGHGIPEFTDWYRRRRDHSDRWPEWNPEGLRKMRRALKKRYPDLFRGGMPRLRIPPRGPYDVVPTQIPFRNRLKKDNPRWLFVIPWMAMGGADRFNLDAIQALVSRGFEVTIVTTLGNNYTWYYKFAQLTPDIFILPYLLPLQEYPRFLDYLIDSRGYDGILVSNSELGHHLLPYIRARHPQLLIVDYCHMEEDYWQNGGHPRRAAAYHDLIDLQLASSQHLRQWFLSKGSDPERIHVVYTGAKVDLFTSDERMRQEIRGELNISSEVPVILYAGRICEQKQPKVFANVIHNLAKTGIDFVCIVLGDGEDMPWLRRFFSRNRLQDRVRLVGAVPNSEVVKYLSASDIFFLPSKMEGISLAIYEAMSAGLAIVAANVGGQAELVTEECGVLVSRSTQEEEIQKYTDVLTTLLRNPKMIKAMGEAGRKRVTELFNFKKTEEQLVRELTVEARVAHDLVSPYKVSEKLAIEHFRLYIETEFLREIYMHLHHLAPLAAAKKKLDQLHNRILSFLQRMGVYWVIQGFLWRLHKIKHLMVTTLRRAKDLVWIVGHAIKVRIRNKIL
ncbi:MAG: glycosyltransferase, partial [Candidatus Methanomethylicaceae archaeon]